MVILRLDKGELILHRDPLGLVVHAEQRLYTGDDGLEIWRTWEEVAGILFEARINGKAIVSWFADANEAIACARGYLAGVKAGKEEGVRERI